MKKSVHQIEKFLLQVFFKSEREFEVISSYTANKYNIKLKTPKRYDRCDGVDYAIFNDWLDNGFAQGETVKHKGNLAILSKADNKTAVINCRFSSDLVAELNLYEEVPIEELEKCDEEDVEKANASLRELGLEVNGSALLIAEKHIPSSNEMVKFWNSTTEGYGVVRVVVRESVIMYCYFTTSGELCYSMNEVLGNVHDYYFEPMSIGYRRRLDMELGKAGKKWNQYARRVEPVNYKLKKGSAYYFINDKLKVTRAIDDEKSVATQRYLSGNYYHNSADAIEDMCDWNENRRLKLAK